MSSSQAIDNAEESLGVPYESWTDQQKALIQAVVLVPDAEPDSLHGGAELWRTADGLHWSPVILDGFGDRDNYGVGTMMDIEWGFMVATGNTIDGFEVWLENLQNE